MRIIGPPSAPQAGVVAALARRGAPVPTPEFLTAVAPALWEAGLAYGVDPVGLIAQSVTETAAGNFGARITAAWRNPCGLKIRDQAVMPGVTDGDNPLAHAMFPSWRVGAHAHAQHVCAYAGQPLPPGTLIVDPRYTLVADQNWCAAWTDLSGRWAPSASYGAAIERIAGLLGARP